MKDGFWKVAAASPELRVADLVYNKTQLVKKAKEMNDAGVRLLAFPEFSLTGYTCHDLFLQDTLLEGSFQALLDFAEETKELDVICIVGLPVLLEYKLYNVAAVVGGGTIYGMVPKTYLPNYSEFYEARQFHACPKTNGVMTWDS